LTHVLTLKISNSYLKMMLPNKRNCNALYCPKSARVNFQRRIILDTRNSMRIYYIFFCLYGFRRLTRAQRFKNDLFFFVISDGEENRIKRKTRKLKLAHQRQDWHIEGHSEMNLWYPRIVCTSNFSLWEHKRGQQPQI